jgi:hypothetical protein
MVSARGDPGKVEIRRRKASGASTDCPVARPSDNIDAAEKPQNTWGLEQMESKPQMDTDEHG